MHPIARSCTTLMAVVLIGIVMGCTEELRPYLPVIAAIFITFVLVTLSMTYDSGYSDEDEDNGEEVL